MAEGIARLEETASQTLKVQITATGLYRYRLGGMAHDVLHIKKHVTKCKNEKGRRAVKPCLPFKILNAEITLEVSP
jgi:hypothetical protein